jgi:uncharacterized repeat protein (TIGR01451 family)
MNIGLLTLALPLGAAPAPAPPPPPPAPLLFVRVLPPEGTRVTYYPGTPLANTLAAPAAVGLRPGYTYRVVLTDVPGRPKVVLTPSLEVRGALQLPPPGNPAEHPVPVVFSAEDIDYALAGGMVTKVLYLEHPDYAAPVATGPDKPVELNAASEKDALTEARERGRVMLIARLGERPADADELAASTVPNTVLLPGQVVLPMPPVPPCLPWDKWVPFDPILGPKPFCEECLTDGGDAHEPLGIGPLNRLGGLNPSDTAIEYTTAKGRRVGTSNRVCLCVPRYAALRVVQLPAGTVLVERPVGNRGMKGISAELTRVPPVTVEGQKGPLNMKGRERPSTTIGEKFPQGVELLQGRPQITAMVQGVRVTEGSKGPEDITAYPCKLMLTKWVEPKTANIGDTVTFYLRYRNPGPGPITEVVVSDSLTGRLEYVAGSAQSDREAVFTVAPNEAGSVVLRWAIGGAIQPGQYGVLSFRAKVR